MEDIMEDITEKKLLLNLKVLVREMGRNYGVDMLSVCRKRRVILARQVLTAIIHKELWLTLIMTGKVFGQNHATIIHSIKSWNNSKELKDPSSRTMQQHYEDFLPHIKQFRRQMIDKSKDIGQIILEDTEIIEQKINRMERKMDEQMILLAKMAEEKGVVEANLFREKKRKEEYKEKYEALQRDYELVAPSKEEKAEIQRLTSYV
jgi:hypothetical protein